MTYDPERVLLNKVGWLQYYGYRDEEGSAAATEDFVVSGTEINFKSFDGKYYGLAHTKSMNIQRLGGSRDHRSLRHVLIVSVAPHPSGEGQRIVGWQPDSWVLARRKERKDGRTYNYQGKIETAVLLPESERTVEVPSGKEGMGQSMLVYGCDTKGKPKPWLQDVLGYMESYAGPNLIS